MLVEVSSQPERGPGSWEEVLALILDAKQERRPLRIPILAPTKQVVGSLVPLSVSHLVDRQLVDRFVCWRNQNREGWLDQRAVTAEGTLRWLERVVNDPLRMSFLIYWGDRVVGRCGFLNLTVRENESDGLVRGERGGGYYFMRDAQLACLRWQFEALGLQAVYSRVLSTNERALNSCRLLGYDMSPFARKRITCQPSPLGDVLKEAEPGLEPSADFHTAAELLYLRLTRERFVQCVTDLGW